MTWLVEKQSVLIAFRPRIEQAFADRDEALRGYRVSTAKLTGGIAMAIGFGTALGLENFDMKPTKDLQSMATSLSPKRSGLRPDPELKRYFGQLQTLLVKP